MRRMNEALKNSHLVILLVPILLEVTETQPDPEPIPLVERPPRSRPTGPLPAHDQSMQNTPVRNTWLVVFTELRDVEVQHELMWMSSVCVGDVRLNPWGRSASGRTI